MKEVKILDFTFCGNELKKAANDSLLAESGDIAKLTFQINGVKEFLSLRVCGDVRLIYKDEVYTYPCDYPDELTKLIMRHKAYDQKELEIGSNNWVELVYSENGYEVDDCNEVVDGKFGNGTPLQAYEYLKECIPLYYKNGNETEFNIVEDEKMKKELSL